jgi:multidrug resistance efflux pump
LQIAVAQAQLVAVEHQVAQATALKDAAEVVKNKFEGVQGEWDGGSHQVLVQSGTVDQIPPEIADEVAEYIDGDYTVGNFELHIEGSTYELYTWVNPSLPLALHLAPNQWWQAWVGVNAATARQEGMESSLAHLYSQYNQPQSLEAKADEALAALAQAEAQIVAAQAQVDGLKAGANAAEIAALEARVAQAQATLDSLLAQQALLQITSPMAGVVVDVMVHPGEVAAAGATLLTVADLSEVRLVVYLPQSQIGRVSLEQGVEVTVDAFPGRVFTGRVVHIADQAEFTPRNVATTEERANLVLAVEILLANEANALKPGMPAEAVFVEEAR